jgi:20S proteasome subunit beta 6
LTKNAILTAGGMLADIETLVKNLQTRIRIYVMQNKREPTIESLAKLLSNTLYGRRFMPYYSFNLLCGIDSKTGEGVVFGYDAVGSFDKITYGCQGSGNSLAAPILDNQFTGHNHMIKTLPTSIKEVEDTTKDIINSIAERDIYTGDATETVTVSSAGINRSIMQIRRD